MRILMVAKKHMLLNKLQVKLLIGHIKALLKECHQWQVQVQVQHQHHMYQEKVMQIGLSKKVEKLDQSLNKCQMN